MDALIKDEDGRTDLHRAKGDCSHLISIGADVNVQDEGGWTPLMIAASSGDFMKARSLLATPNIQVNLKNESDCTALTYAASRGNNDILTLLLQRDDTNLNVQDKYAKNTPLMRAIVNKQILSARKLLQADARVDMRDVEGNTALHYACAEGIEEIVGLLLDAGADLETKNKAEQTPFNVSDSRMRGFLESWLN